MRSAQTPLGGSSHPAVWMNACNGLAAGHRTTQAHCGIGAVLTNSKGAALYPSRTGHNTIKG